MNHGEPFYPQTEMPELYDAYSVTRYASRVKIVPL